MNDDEKYLDPEQNPMIPAIDGGTVDPDVKIEDPYLDPSQNPMIPGGDAIAHDLTMLNERIGAAFPGKDEIEIGKQVLIRMASGTYNVKQTGEPVTDLPPAALLAINDFLKDRQKG